MKTQFKLGQVVRFKNYRRNNDEKEAYFVVIQEEDVANEMVLYTINSNRIYISGTTIIPEFPEEDLRIVTLRPSDLLHQKITIKETIFNEVVTGKVVNFTSADDTIYFKQIGAALVSETEFEFFSNIEHRLMGPLYIDRNYKNNNQSWNEKSKKNSKVLPIWSSCFPNNDRIYPYLRDDFWPFLCLSQFGNNNKNSIDKRIAFGALLWIGYTINKLPRTKNRYLIVVLKALTYYWIGFIAGLIILGFTQLYIFVFNVPYYYATIENILAFALLLGVPLAVLVRIGKKLIDENHIKSIE